MRDQKDSLFMAASTQTANDIVQRAFYTSSLSYICSPLDFGSKSKITKCTHDVVANHIVLWRIDWMRRASDN
ncbi:MAG: hypothetical protein DMG65_04025 [Candidatus Angelobacter sp. Gp1-AA117]|nr:MAG: hypothetical protein DMG65_04025 [Candidatus Angelobacter sp. Gp1-AA117]